MSLRDHHLHPSGSTHGTWPPPPCNLSTCMSVTLGLTFRLLTSTPPRRFGNHDDEEKDRALQTTLKKVKHDHFKVDVYSRSCSSLCPQTFGEGKVTLAIETAGFHRFGGIRTGMKA